jgi:hypothetical protein
LSKRLLTCATALAAVSIMAGCNGTSPKQPQADAITTSPSAPVIPAESPNQTSPSPSAPASPSAAGGGGGGAAHPKPSRCGTENLRATLRPFEWPGHAGAEQDAELGLTNVGRQPCVLEGYAGLRLIGADGDSRPTKVIRVNGGSARPITLASKATGWALVAWVFMPDPDEENTSPLCGGAITRMRVTPPGNTATVTATAKIGSVCRHGEVAIWPFQQGRPSASPPR